jgi:RNA polymerase sigma-70 factor (ECF subfamily)
LVILSIRFGLIVGGVSLAYLIFACGAGPVTRLRMTGVFLKPVTNLPRAAKSLIVSEGEQELRALMIRYQGGSLEAFQEIYAQLAPGVRRYLSHMAGRSEIADDLLQETFLQMHRSRAAYNPEYAVRPWVFGLARNVFLMNRRAARNWAKVHETREDLPEFPVLPEADRLGTRDELRRGLAHLPPDQAEALLLRHEWGFSFEEIAGMLGISAAAARARASRGMAELRVALNSIQRARA